MPSGAQTFRHECKAHTDWVLFFLIQFFSPLSFLCFYLFLVFFSTFFPLFLSSLPSAFWVYKWEWPRTLLYFLGGGWGEGRGGIPLFDCYSRRQKKVSVHYLKYVISTIKVRLHSTELVWSCKAYLHRGSTVLSAYFQRTLIRTFTVLHTRSLR